LVLLVLASAITLTVTARQNLKYDAPYPDIKASTDSFVIARGKHLIYSSAHCINCHSRNNPDSIISLGQDVTLSGGVLFDLPVGKVYSKNITPDKETGIGKYSDAEIARALRYGVHPDGRAVLDFMPFHNTSDEDLTAIISYLRSQKPVRNHVPDNTTNLLGKFVKAFLLKPTGPNGIVLKSIPRDTTAAYGGYLTSSVANCRGCHTKRDMATGAFIGEDYSGGMEIEGVVSPNLTPDSTGILLNVSKEQFTARFRMGKLIPKSPMPWNSFKRMTDDELTAIYNYLKTLQPKKKGQLLNN
jgi:mono/diheme cytochrome c family protein